MAGIVLLLLPVSAMAARRYEKPDRELTPAEKKIGSVFRGCIGFHCLEEAPMLGLDFRKGADCTEGDVCLGISANARDGVIVLMRGDAETEVCLVSATDGLEKFERREKDCLLPTVKAQPFVKATDDLENGQAAFTTGETEASSNHVHFITVMAY